ncbi:MAG: MATE family efflux transporter [Firmicutes bacterium]|nr:MATE family efflux transporter [Bacillota bacterium]
MSQNITTTDRLGTESVGKLLFSLSIPAITAQIVNMLYNLVDRVYIGHIPNTGALALTGVGLTFPVIMVISAFSSLIGMGGAPRASIAMGRGDHQDAEEILGNCFTVLLGLSLGLTAVFLVFSEPLLMMFGASQQTLPYALSYLRIYVCGTIFVQLSLGLNSFITAQGFAKTSMYTVLIGAVANIILDPIFIFALDMGVAGAAIATVISQGLSALWVLRFLTGPKTKLRIRRRYLRPRLAVMIPVLMLGVSPFVMSATESLLNIAFNSSLQKYGGDMAVGAMTILASLMQILTLPIMGLTQGAQPIISYNYGAKNNSRVRQAFRLLLISSVAFSCLFWITVMAAPRIFVNLFSTDPVLVETTTWAMGTYMAVAFVMGAQIACQQAFIALGQAKISLFLALLRKIILLIPLIYLLPNFFADKVFAVFLAEPISDFLAVVTTVTVFAFQFRRILAANTVNTAGTVEVGAL